MSTAKRNPIIQERELKREEQLAIALFYEDDFVLTGKMKWDGNCILAISFNVFDRQNSNSSITDLTLNNGIYIVKLKVDNNSPSNPTEINKTIDGNPLNIDFEEGTRTEFRFEIVGGSIDKPKNKDGYIIISI